MVKKAGIRVRDFDLYVKNLNYCWIFRLNDLQNLLIPKFHNNTWCNMAMAHTNGIFIEPMFHQDEAFTSDALEVIKLKFGMI